jgi:hypothetical protein
MGLIEKQWQIDDAHQTLTLSYQLHWEEAVVGSLRLGHVTLFPESFDAASMVFKTHNGGRDLESFDFGNMNIDHGEAISFLISGKQALGLTQGYVELSDAQKILVVQTNPSQIALVGLMTHQFVDGKDFNRLSLSALEIDDTSKLSVIKNKKIDVKFSLKN